MLRVNAVARLKLSIDNVARLELSIDKREERQQLSASVSPSQDGGMLCLVVWGLKL